MKTHSILAVLLTLASVKSFAGEQISCDGENIKFDLVANDRIPQQSKAVIRRGPQDIRVSLIPSLGQTGNPNQYLYQSYDDGPVLKAELRRNGANFELSIFENGQLIEKPKCRYRGEPNPRVITEACQPGGGTFNSFPGAYTVHLQIGQRLFQDQLLITSMSRSPGMLNFKESLRGKFTVPGVFQSDIYDGIVTGYNELDVSFRIEANENGQTYPVFFTAKSDKLDLCTVTGQAYILKANSDSQKELMGTFRLTKNTPDCTCGL